MAMKLNLNAAGRGTGAALMRLNIRRGGDAGPLDPPPLLPSLSDFPFFALDLFERIANERLVKRPHLLAHYLRMHTASIFTFLALFDSDTNLSSIRPSSLGGCAWPIYSPPTADR